jgi:uncharacterized protein YegP (UPF0339 family)
MTTYEFRMYRDIAGGWRWRLVSTNGRIVADSGEAYSGKRYCKRAIDKLKTLPIALMPTKEVKK